MSMLIEGRIEIPAHTSNFLITKALLNSSIPRRWRACILNGRWEHRSYFEEYWIWELHIAVAEAGLGVKMGEVASQSVMICLLHPNNSMTFWSFILTRWTASWFWLSHHKPEGCSAQLYKEGEGYTILSSGGYRCPSITDLTVSHGRGWGHMDESPYRHRWLIKQWVKWQGKNPKGFASTR